MSYKILKSFKGSPDGFTVIDYTAGEVVEMVASLAVVALAEKWIVEVKTPVSSRIEAAIKAEENAVVAEQERLAIVAEQARLAEVWEALHAEVVELEKSLAHAPKKEKEAIAVLIATKQAELDALVA